MRKNLHTGSFFLFALISFAFSEASFGQHNPVFGAGNSYVNITRKTTGGIVQPGDILEIRTNYFFGGSYNSASSGNLYKVRYYDSVPLKTTMLTGAADSLRLITNEGVMFRKYTLAGGDDAGTYTAAPGAGKYQVRINIGTTPGMPLTANPGLSTDSTGAGNLKIGTYKPQLFGGTLITTSFKVQVTAVAGDTITLGIGKLIYRKTPFGADTVVNATPYKILVSPAGVSGLCTNALGSNLTSEYGGTFDSGKVQNRVSGPIYPIPSYDYKPLSYTTQTTDGSYAIVNNLSPTGSTNANARIQPSCTLPTPIPAADSCKFRMHGGFWDIIGDHTGSATPAGNKATAPGAKGGYMLVVNADVVTSEAYRQVVTGLCPSTYYEYSAWLRNVCRKCAIDSNSTQTYKPGVLPNLTFAIDNLDIYSTGQLDTVGWQKKGFVFRTGPSQTTATISIRNNASGGGGNDWAIDDIKLGTCGPSMSLNFKPILLGCNSGVLVTLADTIKYSYNPNYSYYIWQKSTNGGATWVNTTATGTITPVLTGGYYQFVTKYPPFMAYGADSGSMYRVVVATSNANLSSSTCSFTDGNSTFLKIINCGIILSGDIVSFKGELSADRKTFLYWDTRSEMNLSRYEIEKSFDEQRFEKIGEATAKNMSQLSSYRFTDEKVNDGNNYYRLKIVNDKGLYKYSNTIVINPSPRFEVNSFSNPFKNNITATIILPAEGKVNMRLYNAFGKKVMQQEKRSDKGLNHISLDGLSQLSPGMYFITVDYNNQSIQRKLLKVN